MAGKPTRPITPAQRNYLEHFDRALLVGPGGDEPMRAALALALVEIHEREPERRETVTGFARKDPFCRTLELMLRGW